MERANAASSSQGLDAGPLRRRDCLVTELESAVPGFPPLHTVVAFWSPERKHYHFKVFKPLEQVTEDDMPPAWYKDALAVTPGVDCGCC